MKNSNISTSFQGERLFVVQVHVSLFKHLGILQGLMERSCSLLCFSYLLIDAAYRSFQRLFYHHVHCLEEDPSGCTEAKAELLNLSVWISNL